MHRTGQYIPGKSRHRSSRELILHMREFHIIPAVVAGAAMFEFEIR